CLQGYNSPYSF
nr:immunoglobulin light chain junction region [Macaca mulatta]MOY03876.1 immunoglobulin light chain junction region [Macaca mulatta]MOY04423.1 immunoglobulin light chain junction region [Macaca mulatta]